MENPPAIPTAPTQAPAQPPLILMRPRPGIGLAGGLILAAGLGFGGWKFYKWYVNKKQLEAGKLVNTDPNYRAAAAIRSATDGWYGLRNWDGSKTDVIIRASAGATDYAKMMDAYKELTGDDLEKLLRDEKLSTADYEKFQNSWKFRNSGDPNAPASKPEEWKVKFQKGDAIFAEKKVNIRKTPVLINPNAAIIKYVSNPIFAVLSEKAMQEMREQNNILRTAATGAFLGRATGKTSFDTRSNQGTLFIEVMMPATKNPESKDKIETVTAWVAASQIKAEPWEAAKAKVNKQNITYLYLPFYQALNGPTGETYEVISIYNTHGINERTGQRHQVPGGLILGDYAGSKNGAVIVATIDGVNMRVPKPDIQIRKK